MNRLAWIGIALLGCAGWLWAEEPAAQASSDRKKKIVFIAGVPSHMFSEHEYYAGCTLLAKHLNENVKGVEATVFRCVLYRQNWPVAPAVLEGADAVILFSNGEGGSPLMNGIKSGELAKLMKAGAGMGCIHYAVEALPGDTSEQLKGWIGGCFETFWSVNPTWKAEFKEFPKHPVANGLKPFAMRDEWYFNMRFVENMTGVTPILSAIPTDAARGLGNKRTNSDAHTLNDHVRAHIGKEKPEHLAWVYERPDGGRGFGVTGAHNHWSWANDNFRKTVLNAIVWTAKLEVPADGVPSKTPTWEELTENLDKKIRETDLAKVAAFMEKQRVIVQKLIESWNVPAAK